MTETNSPSPDSKGTSSADTAPTPASGASASAATGTPAETSTSGDKQAPKFAFEVLVAGWGNPAITRQGRVNGRMKTVVLKPSIPPPTGAAGPVRKTTPDWLAQATKSHNRFPSPSGAKTGRTFTEAEFDALLKRTGGIALGHDVTGVDVKGNWKGRKTIASHPVVQDKIPKRTRLSRKQQQKAAQLAADKRRG